MARPHDGWGAEKRTMLLRSAEGIRGPRDIPISACARRIEYHGTSVYTALYTRQDGLVATMAFHVKDKATDSAVRRLAQIKRKTLTETIREAVEHEYQRERARIPLIDRLRPIQEKFEAVSRPGGLPADKAFFDELSGDL
jgi:antitoxin VapB